MAGVRDADARAADLLGGTGTFDTALVRWAAEARVDEAARARVRARWLQIQAEQDASLAGVLVDLAERSRPVVLDALGQRLRGRVSGVGADFAVVASDRGQQVVIRFDTIDLALAEPGTRPVTGDRAALVDVTFDAVLGPLAADRPDVLVRTRAGGATRGTLQAVGADVVRMRVEAAPPLVAWVPVSSIGMLVVDP